MFTILSVLTIFFGPHIVDVFQNIIVCHWQIALAVVAGLAVVILLVTRWRRNARPPIEEPVQISQR